MASSDDATSDDEDGLIQGTYVAGSGSALRVLVSGVVSTAYVDAWVDWEGDGSWDVSHDRIAQGLVVTNGVNAIPVQVPVHAHPGDKEVPDPRV